MKCICAVSGADGKTKKRVREPGRFDKNYLGPALLKAIPQKACATEFVARNITDMQPIHNRKVRIESRYAR
jgi:hypothetical protein